MVVYAYIMGVSVAGLFAAGFVPGIMMGGGLMLVTSYLAKKRNYPKSAQKAPKAEVRSAFGNAFLPLLTPFIILGGILSGIFTPTEAAAAAVAYSLILSLLVTRTLDIKAIPEMLYRAGISSPLSCWLSALRQLLAG